VASVRSVYRFILVHLDVQLWQHHLLKCFALSLLICCRSVDSICVTLFLGFGFCSIDLIVYAFTNTTPYYLLKLYSKLYSKLGNVSLQLFLEYGVDYLGPLPVSINFRICLLANIHKITCQKFGWDHIGSTDQVVKNCHLDKFKTSFINRIFLRLFSSFIRAL
jgi:hypothetical protein